MFFRKIAFPWFVLNFNGMAKAQSLLLRKGRLLNRWHRKRCIIYNGTIRVESPNGALGSAGDDEILTVTKFTAQVVEDNKTRCLRLASSSQQYFFVFEDPVEMQRWISHVTQASGGII